MLALFRDRETMTAAPQYTTNLSKAQGMVPETLELLELWEPGMSVSDLKARVRAMGALGKATQTRVDDVVGRAFAQRFLAQGGKPAEWLRHLMLAGASRGLLRQLALVYTARANLILHDFIREVFWLKYSSRAGEVTKQDARDFIDRAVSRGALEKRWSDSMVERVTRYLLGTLVDFGLSIPFSNRSTACSLAASPPPRCGSDVKGGSITQCVYGPTVARLTIQE